MKQTSRFFLAPTTFINQLQWSRHHWFLILAFGIALMAETYFGRYGEWFAHYGNIFQYEFGIGESGAIALLTALKLTFMIAGLYLLTTILWFVGNFIGSTETSKRVLFRRLAVVATVFTLGYTAGHLVTEIPEMAYAALGMYIWGGYIAFIAYQEQFNLSLVEAALFCVLSIVMVKATWVYSQQQITQVAKSYYTSTHPVAKHR